MFVDYFASRIDVVQCTYSYQYFTADVEGIFTGEELNWFLPILSIHKVRERPHLFFFCYFLGFLFIVVNYCEEKFMGSKGIIN